MVADCDTFVVCDRQEFLLQAAQFSTCKFRAFLNYFGLKLPLIRSLKIVLLIKDFKS